VPWKSSTPVDLRTEFMSRVLRGETVAQLCREYGISRKTGDKFKQRFKRLGEAGLVDLSRAPKVIPHRTPPELVELIVAHKRKHPTWGPKKVKETLEGRLKRVLPAVSTVGDILLRAGLVQARFRRRNSPPQPTKLREAHAPNDIWCIDYKGQFRLGDRSLCYPLTLTDQRSRFILGCDGMTAISDDEARESCEEIFHRYGLPKAMRSDNGVPFASNGLANLTQLSAYWLRLGIELERIRPAHPEENGRHERMHRTLKFETTRPPRTNLLQQQERFDEFVEEFNHERPHEALDMKRPAQIYKPSPRKLPKTLPEPNYPEHDDVVPVSRIGHIYFRRKQVYLSSALAFQYVGLREESDGRWLVTFMNLDLGHVSNTGFIPL
jgi:transposase InsO family protein